MFNFELIKPSLLNFWAEQFQFTREEDAIHIAYPLLLPNGWQISFSIYFHSVGNVFELSDNHQITDYLSAYFSKTPNINKKIIKEKCVFFGIDQQDDGSFKKFIPESIKPQDIQLFAEGMLSIAYLVYRFEKRNQMDSLPYETVKQIFISYDMPFETNLELQGKSFSKIHADFKQGNSIFRVINSKDPFLALQISSFQFNDYKLGNPNTKRALIYNQDNPHWTSDCQSIVESPDYFEFSAPYTDIKEITGFVLAK